MMEVSGGSRWKYLQSKWKQWWKYFHVKVEAGVEVLPCRRGSTSVHWIITDTRLDLEALPAGFGSTSSRGAQKVVRKRIEAYIEVVDMIDGYEVI